MSHIQYNRIKVVLAEKQKTGKWLATQLGCSSVTVSRWSSNKCQPPIEQLYEVAKILNVEAKELLNENSNLN